MVLLKPEHRPQLISEYDALVLPTYYDTEGHPGVLIEAMHAGVPVITTQVRTFPELITHGVNGFLLPKLRIVISWLRRSFYWRLTPELRKRMGKANHLKSHEFCAENVVGQLLKIVFPGLLAVRRAS